MENSEKTRKAEEMKITGKIRKHEKWKQLENSEMEKPEKTEKSQKNCQIRKLNLLKNGELKCKDDTCLLASKIQLDSSSLQFQVASTGLLIGYFDYLALS